MSADINLPTIELPIRRVARVSVTIGRYYAVFEKQLNGSWDQVSPDYAHSTSAFAKLGHLYNDAVVQADSSTPTNIPASKAKLSIGPKRS